MKTRFAPSIDVPIWFREHSIIEKIKNSGLAKKIQSGPLGRFHPSPKQKRLITIGLILFAVVVARGAYHFIYFESTDDAFVTAHVHVMSSRIIGTVQEIVAKENQRVKKGDVLIKLDPRDYATTVKAAQANYAKAHRDLGRFQGFTNLLPTEKPVFDQYEAQALVSEADLEKAQLQLEYTTIVAPTDGKVGKQSVESGELVQAGQAILPLVEDNPWIEANFKESQVSHLKVGQDAEISVDAISGHTFHGKVESISPASGSTFSLLPPDNATGNFTKIVQRIPVRISIDAESMKGYEDRVVSGMSTEITVKTF